MRTVIVIIGLIFAALALGFIANKKYTKSFSPETISRYSNNGLDIKIFIVNQLLKRGLSLGQVKQLWFPLDSYGEQEQMKLLRLNSIRI